MKGLNIIKINFDLTVEIFLIKLNFEIEFHCHLMRIVRLSQKCHFSTAIYSFEN
jgi:hypothetical protein